MAYEPADPPVSLSALAQAAAWHRQIAALAAAADRAGVAAAELPAVRARLLAQQIRFAEVATRTGAALPQLVPGPTEVAAAAVALGDLSPAATAAALYAASSTLDAMDAALATQRTSGEAGQRGNRPLAPPAAPWVRNVFVYGGYAFAVLVVQLVLLATLDEQRILPLSAPFCLIMLPALAWAAGWFTVGVAFRAPPGAPPVKRTPRLGALICVAPNLLLCAGLGALYVAR